MNKEALHKVIARLHVQQVYISALNLKVDPEFTPAAFADPTSSLYAWKTPGATMQELTDAEGRQTRIVKFTFETNTKIAKNTTGKPFPDHYRPPESDVIAEIEATFVADYAISGDDELDQKGIQEFAQLNLPYHVWPYWREQLQNIATRALIPIPMLPFYRVPVQSQPINKGDK